MSILRAAASGAMLFAFPVPVIAQSVPGSAAVPHVLVVAYSFPDESQIRGVMPVGETSGWIREADFPEDVRNNPRGREAGPNYQVVIAQIGLHVTVEADDSVSDCRGAYGSVDLAPNLCGLIRARGKFRHALTLDGSPARGKITVTVQYSMSGPDGPAGLPPAPGPDPEAWPVRWTRSEMRIAQQPQWTDTDTSGDADVGVLLYFPAEKPPRCTILHRSIGADPPRIVWRSCAAALAARYAPRAPGGYGGLPLIVRWRKGRPVLIEPVHQRWQEASPVAGPLRVSGLRNPGTLNANAQLYLDVTESGDVTRCRIADSAGSDAADIEMCRQGRRMRFRPAEDVFGRPMASPVAVTVSFE